MMTMEMNTFLTIIVCIFHTVCEISKIWSFGCHGSCFVCFAPVSVLFVTVFVFSQPNLKNTNIFCSGLTRNCRNQLVDSGNNYLITVYCQTAISVRCVPVNDIRQVEWISGPELEWADPILLCSLQHFLYFLYYMISVFFFK